MADMAASVARFSAGMDAFKDEIRVYKDESARGLRAYKDEATRERIDFNRRLGEIANKQGRLVEDIVAPSVGRVLCELLGLPEDSPLAPEGPRVRLRHPSDPSRIRELDALAAYGGTALVVEVKSQLAPEGVSKFASSLTEAREVLAPLGITEVIGGVATLYVDPSIVAHASRLGLVVLAVGEQLMERKNPPGFTPRRV